ncbi:hypothetical protein OYE22_16640 [Streptomyces sp. 71268]|uniref:hypothetical protein n=1 Tax=Streptomyces sp. 71268 TaxID=3002640 RepID=UPI0023F7653E|nr:hypothetical protein [Streptomyces sp. 71268]WEV26643.1 hypothetical protein OYE22_16640 [Streptomyces sp. 71268]
MVRAGAGLRLLRAAFFTTVCVALTAGGHVLASCAAVPGWTLGVAWLVTFAVVAPLAGRQRSLPGIAAGLAAGQLVLHSLFALAQRGVAGLPAVGHAHGDGARALPPGVAPDSADGRLIVLAARLVCDEPGRISVAKARRIVGDSGLDPDRHAQAGTAVAGAVRHGSGSVLDAVLPSLPMLLGHLLAALAAGWLLRRGDAALWRVVALSAAPAREVADAALVRTLRAAFALVGAVCAGLSRSAVGPRPWVARAGGETPARPRVLALNHAVIRRGPPRYDLAA